MSKSKRKILIAVFMFVLVATLAVGMVVIAFSLTQQTITSSNLSIEYTAEDIDGSVYAKYLVKDDSDIWDEAEQTFKTSDPIESTGTSLTPTADDDHKSGDKLLFKAADETNAGGLQFPEASGISLSSGQSIYMKYVYENTGDKHYMASMSFDSVLEFENMSIQYGIWDNTNSKVKFSEDRYALVVPTDETVSYWIRISVTDYSQDAHLNCNFNWLLKACDKKSETDPAYISMLSLEFKGSGGSYSVSLSNAGGYDGKIVIPSEINGDPVTTIVAGDMTDEEKAKVKEIIIPDSVTTIGSYAFSDFKNITNIDLPDSIEDLGGYSFYRSSRLQSVKFGKNVSSIGSWAFANTPSLESIEVDPENTTYYSENNCLIRNGENGEKILELGCKESIIPNDVTEIKGAAFILCTTLTEINIPASVTKIGRDNPFGGCARLTSITVDAGNTKYYMQNNCLMETDTKRLVSGLNLESITMPSDTKIVGSQSFYAFDMQTSISIPTGVTEIKESAFLNCGRLSDVTLPSTLETLRHSAFASTKITSITIPKSVTTIIYNPFAACQSLTEIKVEEGNAKYSVYGGCLIEDSIKLKSTTKDVDTVPSGIEIIGLGAFSYRYTLTNINIPNTVKTIESTAFAQCTALESIIIPDSVTSIGVGAFNLCGNLTNVTFANPNNWKAGETDLDSADLSDPETAAKYLSSTYLGSNWTRS